MSQEPILKREYDETWPPVRGEYVIGSPESRMAVVTLASNLCAEGAALIGPCKTENLGVEKVVANTISNSNIRFLLLCGVESKGHLPGDALLALHKNGIDEQGRILGSRGAIPFIQNLPHEAIKRFQDQVELVDRIGLEDVEQIELLIREYSSRAGPYPEAPFQVVKRRIKPADIYFGKEDISFGSSVALDSNAWLVVAQEDYHA